MSEDSKEQVLKFGQKLMYIDTTSEILELVSSQAKTLLDAQRCSIFVVDKENHTFWTKVNDGTQMIVIPLDTGIVGRTYKTKQAQIVNLPYEDKDFMSNVDEKIGFTTKNIVTAPVFDSNKELISVIQLLNKIDTDFNDSDLKLLTFFANFISGSLELSLMDDWL